MDMDVRAAETEVGAGRPPPLFADKFTPSQSGGEDRLCPPHYNSPLRPWMLRARRKCTQQKPAAPALDWLTYSLVGSNRRRYSKVNNLEKEAR